MADSIIRSTLQGRIAAVVVGIGAGYLIKRYGLDIGPEGQEVATEALSETIGSIGAWVASGLAVWLAGRSKVRQIRGDIEAVTPIGDDKA